IAGAFEIGGYGGSGRGETTLAKALVGEQKKQFVSADGPADIAAELIPLEAGQCDAALIGEKIVGVQDGVPQEFEGAAMELVAARLVDQVEHRGHAASEFSGEVLSLQLEFGDRVDGRKYGDAGETVDGRKGAAGAVDEDIEGAAASAIDTEADAVVCISDAAGESRRKVDETVDVA